MFNLKIPQSIFFHANGFHKASVSKTEPPHPLDMIALVTNSAFASELYLKCLIHIETGQLMKAEHNLRKLFSKLSNPSQAEIEKRFNAVLAQQKPYDLSQAPDPKKAQEIAALVPTNLRDALKAGENAFVDWRYLYEEEDGKNFFSLFPLPHILRQLILEKKPEWANFGVKMTKLGSVLPTSPAPKMPEPDGGPSDAVLGEQDVRKDNQ